MTDRTNTASGLAGVDEHVDETSRLISSTKVEGTKVYGPDGEHMGSVDCFVVDKISGKVPYAVMSFGGFLGIGERYHPLPWAALKYDTGVGGYVVNITRDQLEAGPTFARDEEPWSDPDYGRNLHSHYGLAYGF